jgi:uncharacterized repeat protein (TIGR03803 family)
MAPGAQACCTLLPGTPTARFPSGLIFDNAGNLYGTTNGGGPHLFGTVYKLTPSAGGQWTETILYGFSGAADGGSPQTGAILGNAGNLYGTTPISGIVPYDQAGVVFEITP